MGQRLIKQGKMYTDSGWQSWSLLKCEVTGDMILRFGNSFTLRGAPGELGPVFQMIGDQMRNQESKVEVSER